MVALWRKSSKLGWKSSFQMTNTELSLQTGIKSRDTINTHRSKLVNAGLISYTSPPRGSSRGNYLLNFNLIEVEEVVRELDSFSSEVVQKSDNFDKVDSEPVRKSDNYPDTVLKDLITTTTNDSEFSDDIFEPSSNGGMVELLNAYCKMHNKLDIHVNPNEREAMGKMVAGGTPNPFTIRTMASLLEAKRQREGVRFRMPKSFLYYVEGIQEAWESHLAVQKQDDDYVQTPNKPKGMTKQEIEIAELDRFIAEEEQKRGSS